MKCTHCGTEADYSFRFCLHCGQSLYIDLLREDLTPEHFLDVMDSAYNLIITKDNKDRDNYYHPVSRALINKRYELEYDALVKSASFSFERSDINTFQIIAQARSSNAVTGYSIRVSEELITKKRSTAYLTLFIENAITSFSNEYKEEYIVKNIASNMPTEDEKERLLFIFFIQNDNKHMQFFLDETMLNKWFNIVLGTNAERTLEKYHKVFSKISRVPKKDDVYEEVLNDIVFGYCVRLSETLFPIT